MTTKWTFGKDEHGQYYFEVLVPVQLPKLAGRLYINEDGTNRFVPADELPDAEKAPHARPADST